MRGCAGFVASPLPGARKLPTSTLVSELDEQQLIERWLEVMEHNKGRSEVTIKTYRGHLRRLRQYLAVQDLTLLSATPEALEDFAGRYQHEQGVRPISRKVPVTAIRGFYAWLAEKHVLDDNPAACLPTPRVALPLPRTLSLDHAQRLLMTPGIKTFVGLRDTAILAVLIGTGCRASGIRNLNEGDLIWTHTSKGTERLTIRFQEKGKKQRLVPVPLECSLLIRAYLGHPKLDEMDRTVEGGDRVLFAITNNPTVPAHQFFGEKRRMHKDAVRRLIQDYGQQANLPMALCHPHAIRHLYGTELAESEVDLLVRQVLMGHAKPETTEVYTHLAQRKLMQTVDRANPLGKMADGPGHALANIMRRRAN